MKALLHWVQRYWLLLLTLALVALGVLIFLGYWFNWDWAGVGNYTDPEGGFHRSKTLWDWLELLIIPLVLAGGGLWFSMTQKKTELEIAERERQVEREIAKDRQNQTILTAYFDKMTELLLDYNLRIKTEENAEERSIARARTLAVLRSLDGERKGQVLKFLCEAGLINREGCVILLIGADLRGADLTDALLEGAELRMTDLRKANFSIASLVDASLEATNLKEADFEGADMAGVYLGEANLAQANLAWANLAWANLEFANLEGANLENANLDNAVLTRATVDPENLITARTLKGTTMPDGTKYEDWMTKYKQAN
ncbi:MAG: pentapeptide repeat-containing protein [Chloroflexi bacterium]|nr:pentapeptide repeat-containing protein [Chloroflexota bacterium]MCI0576652.1 pentapeptide repeat-containing protein [Chloroflexota bacterium]MCI0648340.1 pentapeptide repeat-containing protein [Chloroflexota bacterium]